MFSRGQHRVIFIEAESQSQLFNIVIICKQILQSFLLHQYLIMFIILSSFPFHIFCSGGICEFRLHRAKTHVYTQSSPAGSVQLFTSKRLSRYALCFGLTKCRQWCILTELIYLFIYCFYVFWGFVISAFDRINSNSSFKLFAVFVSWVQLKRH